VNEDPRVAWLVDWLKQNRQQKVLLICANAETAQELEVCLRVRQGVRSSVFHEGLSLINRDRAAAYFADDEDGAQILICSEIGSEGRNFQFAHHLVLFDLPLNPDLLEQRIGRLDRIGQTETVNIHVPYYENTAQHSLLRWYHEGMNAFERVFPAGMSVFAQCEAALVPALENNTGIDDLINQTQQITEQVLAQLQQGRDRLLELNSFNPENAVDTISEIEHASQARELANYMDAVFDEFGVEQQVHSADSIIVEPGTHMSVHHFPALPEDGLTATYQRHKALVREDMVFLTWEHPMVLGAMDLVLHGDFGNTAFCTLPTDKLPEGTLLLEGVFKLHCMAPKYLQVGRYFDDSYIRVVVDQKANDYSELFSEIELSELAGRIPRTTAQQMIRHARPNIETLVSKANKQIEALQKPILKRAIDNMSAQMDAEHQRLDKLTKINPNIRPIELEYFVESKQILTSYLSDAKFVLDAIRVAIVTEPS
jgi:ATP-dependent helicase HepA